MRNVRLDLIFELLPPIAKVPIETMMEDIRRVFLKKILKTEMNHTSIEIFVIWGIKYSSEGLRRKVPLTKNCLLVVRTQLEDIQSVVIGHLF